MRARALILIAVRTTCVCISLLTAAGFCAAATSPIGIIRASGHFTVEGSQVWGNSTLFDGATVETGAASSDLALRNGARVQLGKESRARVWQNRLVLERGTGQVAAPASFEVVAAGFDIRGDGPGARLRVGVDDTVLVASLAGHARVSNAQGLVLASIPAGRGMSFSMQAASQGTAGAQVMRTGCLLYKENHFIVQDESTEEVDELAGPDLALNTGNRVEVTGVVSATPATVSIAKLLINASTVSSLRQGGCLTPASLLNAQTTVTQPGAPNAGAAGKAGETAPKAGHGLSTGAKVGIIALAGGGAAGAAVAAMGHKGSTSP
jgi:hypothetical protein